MNMDDFEEDKGTQLYDLTKDMEDLKTLPEEHAKVIYKSIKKNRNTCKCPYVEHYKTQGRTKTVVR